MRARAPTLAGLALALGSLGAHAWPHDLRAPLSAAHRACDRARMESLARAAPERQLAHAMTHGARADRLAAVRAAQGARDPSAVREALARAMASDDPSLAASAARSLVALAHDGDDDASPDGRAEGDCERLAPALALADRRAARPDLRAAAALLRARHCSEAPASSPASH